MAGLTKLSWPVWIRNPAATLLATAGQGCRAIAVNKTKITNLRALRHVLLECMKKSHSWCVARVAHFLWPTPKKRQRGASCFLRSSRSSLEHFTRGGWLRIRSWNFPSSSPCCS